MPPVAQASLKPEREFDHPRPPDLHQGGAGSIWDAITSPEWNGRYGYRGVSHYELKPGGKFRCIANEQMRSYGLPEVIVDGEVIEVKPPYKLVQTYRFLFNEEHRKEGFTRLTFEIEQTAGGFCRLTVTHDTAGAPMMDRGDQVEFQHRRRWRMGLDPQRHQDAARDRQDDVLKYYSRGVGGAQLLLLPRELVDFIERRLRAARCCNPRTCCPWRRRSRGLRRAQRSNRYDRPTPTTPPIAV